MAGEIDGRKRPDGLTIAAQTRPQDRLPDIAYVFAPLKHARLDYMVQKAVEMGASRLQPVLTRHTRSRGSTASGCAPTSSRPPSNAASSRSPMSRSLWRSTVYLGARGQDRLLVFCDEATENHNRWQALQQGNRH